MASASDPSAWKSQTLGELTPINDLLEKLEAFREKVDKVFIALDAAIEAIIAVLEIAKLLLALAIDYLSIALRLLVELLQLLKDLIMALIRDLFNYGAFVLPQFWVFNWEDMIREALLTPLSAKGANQLTTGGRADPRNQRIIKVPDPDAPGRDKFVRLISPGSNKQGYEKFIMDIENSFYDEGDPLRPEFSRFTEVSGIIMALAANDVFFLIRLYLVFVGWFYSPEVARNQAIAIAGFLSKAIKQSEALGRNIDPKTRGSATRTLEQLYSAIEGPIEDFIIAMMNTLDGGDNSQTSEAKFSENGWKVSTDFLESSISDDLAVFRLDRDKFGLTSTQIFPQQDTISSVAPGSYRPNFLTVKGRLTKGSGKSKVFMQKYFGTTAAYTKNGSAPIMGIGGEFASENMGYLVSEGLGRFSTTVALDTIKQVQLIDEQDSEYTAKLTSTGDQITKNNFIGVYQNSNSAPIPDIGKVAYFIDDNSFWVYDTGGWVVLMPATKFVFYAMEESKGVKSITDRYEFVTARISEHSSDNLPANYSMVLQPDKYEILSLARTFDATPESIRKFFPISIRPGGGTGYANVFQFGTEIYDVSFEMRVFVNAGNVFTKQRVRALDANGNELSDANGKPIFVESSTADHLVNVKVMHNGQELSPSNRKGNERIELAFTNIKLKPGKNVFEVAAYGEVIDGLKKTFKPAYCVVRSMIVETVGLGAKAAPIITSPNSVVARPSIFGQFKDGDKYSIDTLKNSPLFRNSYFDVFEQDKEKTGMPFVPPVEATYTLTGFKASSTGILVTYIDKQKKKPRAQIITPPPEGEGSVSFKGDIQMFSDGRKKAKGQTYTLKVYQYDKSFAAAYRLQSIIDEYNSGFKDKLEVEILNKIGLSDAATHTVTVKGKGLKPDPVPPDWLSVNLKSIFPIVDPIDQLLQSLVDKVANAVPFDRLEQIDDWIDLQIDRLKKLQDELRKLKDIIDSIFYLLNIGGNGVYFLGINKATGSLGFIERFKAVQPPVNLSSAQYVTGIVFLIPTELGGNTIMTKLFSKLPSAPLPGEKTTTDHEVELLIDTSKTLKTAQEQLAITAEAYKDKIDRKADEARDKAILARDTFKDI